ncbi:MAG: ribosome maturation factor RimP [Eubacterium sp.]|nr:ribosome maturation factor RimP [Eubacterium sp.]
MAKGQIRDIVTGYLTDFLAENGLELYHTDFKKEGRDWYLRVFIDRKDAGEGEYVSTDDCEKVSRYLEGRLDEDDPIPQNYYLMVSSPGLDRQLYEPKDYERFAGELVDVKLYKNFEGSKICSGVLVGLSDGIVTIRLEDGREAAFPLEEVAKTNLAVVF